MRFYLVSVVALIILQLAFGWHVSGVMDAHVSKHMDIGEVRKIVERGNADFEYVYKTNQTIGDYLSYLSSIMNSIDKKFTLLIQALPQETQSAYDHELRLEGLRAEIEALKTHVNVE